jgi:hypothetical protein
MASAARRHGPTDSYADEASREIRRWAALAYADATAGAKSDSTEVMAYAAMLDRCGNGDDDMAAIVRQWPGTVLLRARFLASLGPRCNGTLEGMSRFAATQQSALSLNPRLRVLGDLPAFYEAIYAAQTSGRRKTLAAYARALVRDDFWQVRYERALEYLHVPPRFDEALIDLDRVVEERPGYAPALAWRAATLRELAKRQSGLAKVRLMARAWKDIRAAKALNAEDPEVAIVLKSDRDDERTAGRRP